jgi:hypothetical protein
LSLLYELAFGGGLKWWRPNWKGLSFSVPRCADTEVCHSYTYVDHILIEILFSHPINILQIFELLFHGHIFYDYFWIMLLYVLKKYIITIFFRILVVEDKLQVQSFESSAQQWSSSNIRTR